MATQYITSSHASNRNPLTVERRVSVGKAFGAFAQSRCCVEKKFSMTYSQNKADTAVVLHVNLASPPGLLTLMPFCCRVNGKIDFPVCPSTEKLEPISLAKGFSSRLTPSVNSKVQKVACPLLAFGQMMIKID